MVRIAFDLDDVLGNHTEQFLRFNNRVYKTKLCFDDFTSYRFSRVLDINAEETLGRLIGFYMSSPEFNDISPLPGSQGCIEKLSRAGNELLILTGRPQALQSQTNDWVKQYFPQIKKILMRGKNFPSPELSKGGVCQTEGIELIVEDSFVQAVSCSENGVSVLLLNQPWNKESPISLEGTKITRVDTWEEIYEYTKKY